MGPAPPGLVWSRRRRATDGDKQNQYANTTGGRTDGRTDHGDDDDDVMQSVRTSEGIYGTMTFVRAADASRENTLVSPLAASGRRRRGGGVVGGGTEGSLPGTVRALSAVASGGAVRPSDPRP